MAADRTLTTPFEGGIYAGQTFSGAPHGIGKVRWPMPRPGSAIFFDGAFRHGLRQGPGRQLLASGQEYVGLFEANTPSGSGISSFPDGSYVRGSHAAGTLDGICEWSLQVGAGGEYRGAWQDGRPHGSGTRLFATGDRFEGNLVGGLRNGGGSFTWSSGETFAGSYVGDVRDGVGIYTWPDGSMYAGQFADSCRNGHGVFTYPNGDRFEGNYKLDQRQGPGVFTFANGLVDAGQWRGTKLVRVDEQAHPRQKHGPLLTASLAFLSAALEGDSKKLQLLLDGGLVHPNVVNRRGETALSLAIKGRHFHVIALLLSNGVSASVAGDDDRLPLLLLFEMPNVPKCELRSLCERLLLHGASPNCSTTTIAAPLYHACQALDGDLVSMLLQYGADPNYAGQHQQPASALHALLAGTSDDNVVQAMPLMHALIQAGADPNLLDSAHNTPLHLVAHLKSCQAAFLASRLIEGGARTHTALDMAPPLSIAVAQGAHPDLVACLLRHDPASLEQCQQAENLTTLHQLVAGNCSGNGQRSAELLALLVDANADCTALTSSGASIVDALQRALFFRDAPEQRQQSMTAALLSSLRRMILSAKHGGPPGICFQCGRAEGLTVHPCPGCELVQFCSERCKRLAQVTHHKCRFRASAVPVTAQPLHWSPSRQPTTRVGIAVGQKRPPMTLYARTDLDKTLTLPRIAPVNYLERKKAPLPKHNPQSRVKTQGKCAG